MNEEKEQAWTFLREFTREILVNISHTYLRTEVRRDIGNKISEVLKNKDRILNEIGEAREIHEIPGYQPSKFVIKKIEEPEILKTIPSVKIHSSYEGKPELNFGRMSDILKDEDVYTIECSGPGNFLIVKKPNKEEASPVSLNEEEIKRVISEFADATQIYPSEGVFTTSYKNYSITAVMSDNAGSRFIITRYLDVSKLIHN